MHHYKSLSPGVRAVEQGRQLILSPTAWVQGLNASLDAPISLPVVIL